MVLAFHQTDQKPNNESSPLEEQCKKFVTNAHCCWSNGFPCSRMRQARQCDCNRLLSTSPVEFPTEICLALPRLACQFGSFRTILPVAIGFDPTKSTIKHLPVGNSFHLGNKHACQDTVNFFQDFISFSFVIWSVHLGSVREHCCCPIRSKMSPNKGMHVWMPV